MQCTYLASCTHVRHAQVSCAPAGPSAPYQLNTLISEPHGTARVTSLSYHPQQHMAVTTSDSGEFKVGIAAQGFTSDQIVCTSHAIAKAQRAVICWLCVYATGVHSAASFVLQVWLRQAVGKRPGSQEEQPTSWRCR
jgi:hypothetical protein